jgi:hypothetical protein
MESPDPKQQLWSAGLSGMLQMARNFLKKWSGFAFLAAGHL